MAPNECHPRHNMKLSSFEFLYRKTIAAAYVSKANEQQANVEQRSWDA